MRRINHKLFSGILAITLLGQLPLCLAEPPRNAQREPIEVNAEVDRKSVTIGDKIRYTITVSKKKDSEVIFPDFGSNLGNFTIKDFGLDRKNYFTTQKLTQWYVLDTYVTGTATIPKALIKYKRKAVEEWAQVEAQALEIEVRSVLGSAESDSARRNSDIVDIEGPVNMPSQNNLIILFSLLIVLLVLAAAFGIFSLTRRKQKIVSALRSAQTIACEQLEALQKKDLIAQGKVKEYYTGISDIVRHYLENKFNLNAPEMTTEEFLLHERNSARLQSEHKILLREFLIACDLVKFARYLPAAEESNTVFESAKKFIDQTKEEQKES